MIGIIFSSSVITPELSIDFGNISSSEIPIANDSLSKYQVKFLKKKCDKIFITRLKEKKTNDLGFLPQRIFFVERNLSLISLTNIVLEKFKHQDILILFGDTLIDYPKTFNETKPIIFTTKHIKIRYPNWFSVDKQSYFCGSLYIPSKNIKKILKNKYKTINEFLDHAKGFDNVKIPKGNWFDFGHFHTFYDSKRNFLDSRFFNNISISKNGFIKKSSAEIGKIIYEFNWFKDFEKFFPILTPKVKNLNFINSFTSYELEYINFPSVSEIFVFGKLNSEEKKLIIKKLIQQLNDIQKFKSSESKSNENFIYKKLSSRRDDILKYSNEFGFLNKIDKIINQNLNFFSKKKFKNVLMHGDYCFSNILYNRRTDQIKLIDPRGYTDPNQGYSLYGPYIYDFFKLAHSYIGNYDKIIAGYDTSKLSLNSYKIKLEFFSKFSKIPKDLLLHGMVNLFLSMIPLHNDSKKRQIEFFKTAIKLNKFL